MNFVVISTRLHQVLITNNLKTLDDISKLTESKFHSFKNCGRKSTNEAKKLLSDNGLTFLPELPSKNSKSQEAIYGVDRMLTILWCKGTQMKDLSYLSGLSSTTIKVRIRRVKSHLIKYNNCEFKDEYSLTLNEDSKQLLDNISRIPIVVRSSKKEVDR